MSAVNELKSSQLTNEAGFVTVNKDTLQHTKYTNVFGIGDCCDTPTAKTAAAVGRSKVKGKI